jgi:nicotinamide-nucleotide amidase
LSAWSLPNDEADRRLRAAAALLRGRAGENVYGEGDCDLASLVLEQARARKIRLAVAESCTGGMLGGRLTEVPGSSDVFLGGVIAYDNAVKQELLGVPEALLAQHGAVSEPVAGAMAQGAARRLGAAAALSITGIAGPDGGTPSKPVGTVWIGSFLDDVVETRRTLFPGTRHEIRARAVQAALFLLHRRLKGANQAAEPVRAR